MDFEKPFKKYEIKKENIIPLYELPLKLSPELRAMGWPLELQGSGRTLEDGKTFEVRYPAGDSFYSWNVIIHELGHLRQDELSEEIIKEKDEIEKNLLKEKDAKVRGWERVKKYAPELLEMINQEFEKQKEIDKIPDFDSFEALYNNFNVNNIRINEALAFEEDPSIAAKKLEAIHISNFLQKIEKNKVGVKIDTDAANDTILKIANHIIDEQA